MPDDRLHIVDNRTIPDICLQHLLALTLADGTLTFASAHDYARMDDPAVLAVRRRIEVVPSAELTVAVPARQAIVAIETTDGRTLRHRTYRGARHARQSDGNRRGRGQGARPDGAGDRRRARRAARRAVASLERMRRVIELRPLLQA